MRETSRDVTSFTMKGEEGKAEGDTRGATGLRRVEVGGDLGEAEALVEVEVAEVATVCMTRVLEDSEVGTEASLRREEVEDMRCRHLPRG